jgi:hypothetical protein
MAAFDPTVPEVGDGYAVEDGAGDEGNHSGDDGGEEDVTGGAEGTGGEEVEVEEDEGDFGGGDEDFVEDLVGIEILEGVRRGKGGRQEGEGTYHHCFGGFIAAY